MTATARRPADTAEVTCARCRQPFRIECDRLRELNDSPDPRPLCGRPACAPPAPPRRLTRHDVVLLAVPGPGDHKADIAVRAWERDRAAFGLPGYALTYPNSNPVIVALTLLVQRGLVEPAGTSRYRLTAAGLARVKELAAGGAA